MAATIQIQIDEGTRILRGNLAGVADVTPEQSGLQTPFRPEHIHLEYVSRGLSGWRLESVTISGRPVMKSGEVNPKTRRELHATWDDLTGSGTTRKVSTPKWVVDFAKKHMTTPDTVPHVTQ